MSQLLDSSQTLAPDLRPPHLRPGTASPHRARYETVHENSVRSSCTWEGAQQRTATDTLSILRRIHHTEHELQTVTCKDTDELKSEVTLVTTVKSEVCQKAFVTNNTVYNCLSWYLFSHLT